MFRISNHYVSKIVSVLLVVEVLVLLGYYTSVSLGMKVHEVPIPPPGA